MKVDKLGHHLAGALYGCDEATNDRDYEWWSERVGVALCDSSVYAIAQEFLLL